MSKPEDRIKPLIGPPVEAMGYELVGVEYHAGARRALLRIYIDKETGISVDDCAAVSDQVSGVLDVEDPIKSEYDLEVSSPGLDRPLFEADHYERFRGHAARIKLAVPLDGRRNFKGVLEGCDGEDVVMVEDGQTHRLPLDNIASARLMPEHPVPGR